MSNQTFQAWSNQVISLYQEGPNLTLEIAHSCVFPLIGQTILFKQCAMQTLDFLVVGLIRSPELMQYKHLLGFMLHM